MMGFPAFLWYFWQHIKVYFPSPASGISSISVFTVGIVWCMEAAGGKWKTIVGISMGYAWATSK